MTIKSLKRTKLWATTVNLVLIVVLVNILVNLLPISLDLTANKIHSLSKATKEIIAKTEDIITIKVFVSSNLPPQLTPVKESLRNILGQYQKTGNGKVKLTWLDPQKDDKTKNEALSLGLTPLQFSSLQEDQLKVVQGFFGLAVFYGGNRETIPALSEINNLEYQLTGFIKKMQRSTKITVGFSTGLGESNVGSLSRIRELLDLNYEISVIDLSEKNATLDENISTLIIANPTEKISSKAKLVIDRMLMKKKAVIVLDDQVAVNNGLIASAIENDLGDLLEHYGIKVNKNLVADQSAAFASFRTEGGSFIIPYPLWVKTRQENNDPAIPVTSSIESVVFPWISSLDLSKNAQPLLASTAKSISISDFTNIVPTRSWDFDKTQNKQFVLAAIQTKGSKSFFEENEIKEVDALKLAVIADSDFITDQTMASYPENADFFLNLVDYLSSDEELIKIRSKTVFTRPIKMIDEQNKQIVKIISLAIPPVVVLLVALMVRWKRKKINRQFR